MRDNSFKGNTIAETAKGFGVWPTTCIESADKARRRLKVSCKEMAKMRAVGSVVILMLGVAGFAAYSRQPANEYVAPLGAVPRGQAPNMKVQLLNPGEPTK